MEPKPPAVSASTLSGGACVSGCPGSTALLMVDIYDSNADLIGSYETTRPVAGDACVDVTVNPEMYGITSKVWPRGYMFVIAVNVPQCGLSDQVSGFF